MKKLRKLSLLVCFTLILTLVLSTTASAASDTVSQGKISGYPTFPKVNRTNYVIYKESWRGDRIEICFFDVKKSNSKTALQYSGNRIQVTNGTLSKDVKYYLDSNKKWVKFEEGFGAISLHASKVIASSLQVKNEKDKVLVKAKPVNQYGFKSTSITLKKNGTKKLSFHSLKNTTVKFSTSKKSVATVNSKTGLVTAKKKGIATITIKYSNGKKDTCKITVK